MCCRNSLFVSSKLKFLICTIFLGVCSTIAFFIAHLFIIDRPLEIQPVCVLDGGVYEIITDRKILGELGLKEMVSKDDVGDYIGVCHLEDGTTAEAYDYTHQDGISTAIVQVENVYHFMVYCNPEINTGKDLMFRFNEFLEIYGLQVDEITIIVDEKDESHNELYKNLLRELMSTVGVTFDVFHDGSQMNDCNNFKCEEIVVFGENTGSFKMQYYPELQYVETHLMYFKVQNLNAR